MNVKKLLLIFLMPVITIFLSDTISAHCPLCTAGAAVAAGGAVWLGVHNVVVSLFIGAFAVSMGWWLSKYVKKKYIPYQKTLIIIAVFLLTVLPILPIINFTKPIYLFLTGAYGSILNKTYMLNLSLIGSIFGGLIVSTIPAISKKITHLRKGKIIPFQGVILTLSLLIIIGVVLQLII